MLRSSWLWSDCRYRVVVGLIYDPGHLWPESTHDLIWGSSPVYAWPLTKRGPQHKLNSLFQRSAALASSLCFTFTVHAGSCTGETSRLISHALERPPILYLVHWKDPPSYISRTGKTSPVLYLCALYGVLVGACAREKTRPILFMFVRDFPPLLTLYQNEKMLTET